MNRRQFLALGFMAAFLGAGLGAGVFVGSAEAHPSRFVPAVDVVPEPPAAFDSTSAPAALAWTAAAAPAGVPWPLLAALAGLTVLGSRRPRRSLALSLVLLLAIFAFENGVHSVHHLSDQGRGEHCAAALASQHVAGTEPDGLLSAASPAPAEPAMIAPVRVIRSARSFSPHEGRAPPVSPV